MSDVKKILVVSGVPCYPPIMGNRRRIYNVIKLMKTLGCQVDFLYHSSEKNDNEKEMIEFLGEKHYYFCRTHMDRNSWFYKHSRGMSIERFVPPYPIDVKYLKEVEKKVKKLLKKDSYDVLWVEYPHQSKILEHVDDSIVKIIDTHDKFAYRNYKMFPFTHKTVDYSLSFRGERKVLSRADYVIAIQEDEKRYFNRLLRGKSTGVATIGDTHELVKKEAEISESNNICFIGSEYEPNIDAINWFIKDIFPLISAKVPTCKLIVAGNVCNKIGKVNTENIELLGRVENIDSVYGNCRVAINPVRAGTGLNIKSIEAIAHCIPLVATSVGAKGIFFEKPVVEVADGNREFAEKVIAFLKNSFLCQQYSDNCVSYIKNYNNKNLRTMEKVINAGKWR